MSYTYYKYKFTLLPRTVGWYRFDETKTPVFFWDIGMSKWCLSCTTVSRLINSSAKKVTEEEFNAWLMLKELKR